MVRERTEHLESGGRYIFTLKSSLVHPGSISECQTKLFHDLCMAGRSNGMYKGQSQSIYTPKVHKRTQMADSSQDIHAVFGKEEGKSSTE